MPSRPLHLPLLPPYISPSCLPLSPPIYAVSIPGRMPAVAAVLSAHPAALCLRTAAFGGTRALLCRGGCGVLSQPRRAVVFCLVLSGFVWSERRLRPFRGCAGNVNGQRVVAGYAVSGTGPEAVRGEGLSGIMTDM